MLHYIEQECIYNTLTTITIYKLAATTQHNDKAKIVNKGNT